MPTDADLSLVLENFRDDQRPQALVRVTRDDRCSIVAASRALILSLGLTGEDDLAAWLESRGGPDVLKTHAATRKTMGCDLGEGRSVFLSIREQSPDVYQIRGAKVGPAEVSNSLTAGIIANIANEETGIIFLDPEGRVMAVNDSFYNFFGRAENYPQIGKSFETMLRDSIRLGYLPAAGGREDLFVDGTIAHFNSPKPEPLMVLSVTGRWAITSRLRFSNGAIAILIVDVTDREKEVAQYRSFVQNTRNMIYCRGHEGGLYGKIWGEDARVMAGIADEDGHIHIPDWLKAIHPEDLSRYMKATTRRNRDGTPYRIEYRVIHSKSGVTHHMLENGWRTIDPASGEQHLDSYLIDISGQKRTEAQLKSSEMRFREFASLAGDWYFEADEELMITYLSDGFEDVSGMPRDLFLGVSWELITRNAIAHMDDQHHGAWLDLLDAWKDGRFVRDHRMLFHFASGIKKPISTTAAPIIDPDGRHIGYRGVAKDISSLISAQRQAEAEQQRAEAANRAKSEFIANMSHELRTPLNAIIGFAGVMEQQMFGPIENRRYREYAGDISASGQHLLSLVNDILDLSRIEADRQSCDREWLDLEGEITRVCTLFREEGGQRTFETKTDPADTRIYADRRALRQILINLLSNAIKFSPDNSAIRISGTGCANGISISVSDSGAGMSARDIEIAMEPFGRAVSPEIAGGTGLGLPISRRLAEMHNGDLEIRSAPGEGCCVTVRFPDKDGRVEPCPAGKLSA